MEAGYAVSAEETSYKVQPDRREMKPAKKKPGFLARWLWTGLKTAADSEKENRQHVEELKERAMLAKAASISVGNDLNTEPMRFSVYHASGGFVVETRTPRNSAKNTIGPDSNTKLHIIHKDADLGQELAKIITLEGLRA
jgi:hypothetical protein